MLGLHMPTASAASWFDDSQWFRSTPSFNTRMVCDGYCVIYTLAMSDIAWQGPQGRETQIPKVGERFYIRVRTSVVFPYNVTDGYRMRVLLPAGVVPDIRSNDDVLCAITDVHYNDKRAMPANECQDPVQDGLYQRFPAVTLDRAEIAWFFFPVKATMSMTDATGLGVESDLVSNPWTALPDPLWSSMKLTVAPAPPAPQPPAPTPPAPSQPAPSQPAPTKPAPTKPAATPAQPGDPGPSSPPPAKVGVSASSARGVVVVSWQQPASAVTRYEIGVLRKGKWVKAGKASGTAKAFRWRKGKPGKVYRLRVRAVGSTAPGPWSKPVRIRVK
jgi:hypothetical protein